MVRGGVDTRASQARPAGDIVVAPTTPFATPVVTARPEAASTAPGAALLRAGTQADGTADAIAKASPKVWDVAAGTLLVREAGGTASTFDGKPWSIGKNTLLAANNKKTLNALLGAIKKS